jgi:hypothetical protein
VSRVWIYAVVRLRRDSRVQVSLREVTGVRVEGCFSLGLSRAYTSLHVPRTDSGLDPSVHPPLRPPFSSPHSPFSYSFCLSRIYLLVSSPAGRSFFEKTTRARTTPTPHSQKLRSPPHPNRRHSSTFVSIFPLHFHPTRSPSANCVPLFFASILPRLLPARPPLLLLLHLSILLA